MILAAERAAGLSDKPPRGAHHRAQEGLVALLAFDPGSGAAANAEAIEAGARP